MLYRPCRLARSLSAIPLMALLAWQAIPAVAATDPSGVGLPWRQTTLLPQAVTRPAVAVGSNGTIYVFGGGGGAVSNATFIYYPTANTWTEGADMPLAREGAQAVALPDGRIAVLGGGRSATGTGCQTNLCQDGTVFNRVDVYNPHTNHWGQLAPMQTPRYRFAAALYQGRIYALGGSDGREPLSRVEVYDPRGNDWTYAAPLPQAEEGLTAVVDGRGRLDVIGGFNGASIGAAFYSDLFVYRGGAWTSGPSLPQPVEDAPAVLGADKRVYVVGGFSNGDLSTVQVLNVSGDSWSMTTPLPAAHCCSGVLIAPTGQIYSLGGDGPTASVQVYGPSIRVAESAVRPGSTVSLSGRGFAPFTNVKLYWGGKSSRLLGIGATDRTGSLRGVLSFKVPRSMSRGRYMLTAVDDLSHYPVSTDLVVSASH